MDKTAEERCGTAPGFPETMLSGTSHRWLDPEMDADALKRLYEPFTPDDMRAHRVDGLVGNVRIDQPSCIEPAGERRNASGGSGSFRHVQ